MEVDLWVTIQLLDSLGFLTIVGYWSNSYHEETNSFYIFSLVSVSNNF
jgi:hypothetical protein